MADDEDIDLGLGDEEVRLHPVLSNAEVLKARANARKKVEAERKAKMLEAIEEEETKRLRREEGLTTGIGLKDELVNVTIDLAPFSPRITVNFEHYEHGHTYTVPRHVAETLAEQMARTWQHEDEVKGRSLREHYGTARNAKISGVTGATSESPQVRYDA